MSYLARGELNRSQNPRRREEARDLIKRVAKEPRHQSDPFFMARVLAHFDAGILDMEDLRQGAFA